MTTPPPDGAANRRPIAARRLGPVNRLAGRLVAAGVRPNRISQASMGFAALAFGLFWIAAVAGPGGTALCLLLAAVAIQGRLMCNLLDGMVAVEGGLSEPSGPFWNEAPDRVADPLILAGLGLAAGLPTVGLVCAILAVGTAYLRELGRAEGQAPDFGGPLAKPQRMALATGTALLAALCLALLSPAAARIVLQVGVWIMLAGTALTLVLRSRRLLVHLHLRAGPPATR